MQRIVSLLRAAFLALVVVSASAAPLTAAFTYQGRLLEGGTPANGEYDIDVRLWNASVGGAPLGTPITLDALHVTDGLFTVQLDFGVDVWDGTQLWLEISVNGTELAPRQPITPVPYALQTRGIFVDDAGRVGIGTAPRHPLHVEAIAEDVLYVRNADTTGQSYGAYAQTDSAFGGGVYGVGAAASGPSYGVRGHTNSPDGYAAYFTGFPGSRNFFAQKVGMGTPDPQAALHVVGIDNDGTNATLRVDAGTQTMLLDGNEIDTTSSVGLYLNNNVPHKIVLANGGGNVGIGTTSPNYPLDVQTRDADIALYGRHTATGTGGLATFGVVGRSAGTSGRGVYGYASASSGVNIGVAGASDSPAGFDFCALGAGLNYGSASSIRWKRNVVRIDGPLEKIARLRGVYFDWDEEHGGRHDVGMIAEEVGAVLPEIVNYEANGIDANGIDYSKLTPLLVEAVKELERAVAVRDAEIAALRKEYDARSAKQSQRIADLTARLERLEKTLMENSRSATRAK